MAMAVLRLNLGCSLRLATLLMLAAGPASASNIVGRYYSDLATAACSNASLPVECVLRFEPTPATRATVKVGNLSCTWTAGNAGGTSSIIFSVVSRKGRTLAQRIVTEREWDTGARGALNIAIANVQSPMAIPSEGRALVYFKSVGPGSTDATCTITGAYD